MGYQSNNAGSGFLKSDFSSDETVINEDKKASSSAYGNIRSLTQPNSCVSSLKPCVSSSILFPDPSVVRHPIRIDYPDRQLVLRYKTYFVAYHNGAPVSDKTYSDAQYNSRPVKRYVLSPDHEEASSGDSAHVFTETTLLPTSPTKPQKMPSTPFLEKHRGKITLNAKSLVKQSP